MVRIGLVKRKERIYNCPTQESGWTSEGKERKNIQEKKLSAVKIVRYSTGVSLLG